MLKNELAFNPDKSGVIMFGTSQAVAMANIQHYGNRHHQTYTSTGSPDMHKHKHKNTQATEDRPNRPDTKYYQKLGVFHTGDDAVMAEVLQTQPDWQNVGHGWPTVH